MADIQEVPIDDFSGEAATTVSELEVSGRKRGAGELFLTGLKKLPRSSGQMLGQTVDALNPMHWPRTAKAMGTLVRGGAQALRETSPEDQRGTAAPFASPEEVAMARQFGHQLVGSFTHPLMTWAQDPASALSTWALPLTLGGGALAEAPSILGKVGSTAATVGQYMDPVGAAMGVAGLAGRGARRVVRPSAETIANVNRSIEAGVEPSLAAASNKPLDIGTTTTVANNPVAGIPARTRIQRNIAQTGERVAELGEQYAPPTSTTLAGETVQTGVRRFAQDRVQTPGLGGPPPGAATSPARATTFSSKADALYDNAFNPVNTREGQLADAARVRFERDTAAAQAAADAQNATRTAAYDQAVAAERQTNALAGNLGAPSQIAKPALVRPAAVAPPTPTVTPTATLNTINEIRGAVNAPNLRDIIVDPKLQTIYDTLLTDASQLRFGDLRRLRTWVREAQGNPAIRQGIDDASLGRMEAALTDDIYSSAAQLGGRKAVNNLRRADTFYRAGMDRINTALRPFTDAARSGESAYSRIQQMAGSGNRADLRSLTSLKRSLQPEEWNTVAGNVVHDMGRTPDGTFNINQFVNTYDRMSEGGRNALFGSLGGGGAGASELQRSLDRLVEVARGQQPLAAAGNTVAGSGAQIYSTIALSAFAQPVAATLLTAGAAAGEVMTNPAFVRWLAGAPRAGASAAAQQSWIDRLGRIATTPAMRDIYLQIGQVSQDNKDRVAPPEASNDVPPEDMSRAEEVAPEEFTATTEDIPSDVYRSAMLAAEGTADNPNSTAVGLGQIIDPTFASYAKRIMTDPEDQEWFKGKSDKTIADVLRGEEPIVNSILDEIEKDDRALLQRFDKPVTGANLYLAHFLGGDDAPKIFSAAPDTLVRELAPKIIRPNAAIEYNGRAFKDMTVGDLTGWATNYMNERLEQVRKAKAKSDK
jgi:hypothetical protein